MLPPQEGPEPGYFACVSVLVTQSRANTIVALPHTSFPISDGYAVQTTTTFGAHRGASGERSPVLGGTPLHPQLLRRLSANRLLSRRGSGLGVTVNPVFASTSSSSARPRAGVLTFSPIWIWEDVLGSILES